jgi:hypothetical protein
MPPRRNRFLSAIAAAFLASPALAQAEAFDTALCPTPTGGKVIVRLVSGLAFAVEPGSYLLAHAITDRSAPSDVPQGCAENPLIAASVAIPFYFNAAEGVRRGEPAPIPFGRIESLEVFGHEGPTNNQDGDLRRFEELLERGSSCGDAEGGWRFCHVCYPDPDRLGTCLLGEPGTANQGQPSWDSPTYVVGPPREGEGRSAWPVAFRRGGRWSSGHLDCEARYQLRNGLSVVYKVIGSDAPWEVLPDLLVSADRLVRDSIEALRAPASDGPDIREPMGYEFAP